MAVNQATGGDPPSAGPSTDRLAVADRPLVIAHRGFSAAAPENTLAALRMALELEEGGRRVDMVEVDVTSTADGHVVLLHDATLDRTTDGAGPAMAADLETLQRLDAGAKFHRRFAGERIPTLGAALDLVRGRTLLNIEIKPEAVTGPLAPRDPADGIVPRVVSEVRARGMERQVVVSSFEPEALRRLRAEDPEIRISALYDRRRHGEMGPGEVAGAVGARGFHVHSRFVDRPLVEASHAHGLPVSVYTVNWPWRMERMLDLGVDALFTDRPDRMLQLLERHPGRWRRQPTNL